MTGFDGTRGGITRAEQAGQTVRNGRTDPALVGHEHLRNPYFALEAAHTLGVDVEWPEQYGRGRFGWTGSPNQPTRRVRFSPPVPNAGYVSSQHPRPRRGAG